MPSVFARIASLLYESARLELLSKQFGVPVDEIERDYLPADPTKGKYLTWVMRQVKAGILRFPEDHEKTFTRLEQFAQLSRKPQFQGKKDLNQYKSYAELAQTVAANARVQTKGEVSRQAAIAGAKKIWEIKHINNDPDDSAQGDEHYEVYEITTFEALDAMGAQRTEWCVKDRKYFDQYAEKGLPYYLALENGEPYQLMHLQSGQCMDVYDAPCEPTIFEQAGIDCFQTLTPARILGKVDQAVNYKRGNIQELMGKIAEMIATPGSRLTPYDDIEVLYSGSKMVWKGRCFLAAVRGHAPELIDQAMAKWVMSRAGSESTAIGRFADYAAWCVKGRLPLFEDTFQLLWERGKLMMPRHLEVAIDYTQECLSQEEKWQFIDDVLQAKLNEKSIQHFKGMSIYWFYLAFFYFASENDRAPWLEEAWERHLPMLQITSEYLNDQGHKNHVISAYESKHHVKISR